MTEYLTGIHQLQFAQPHFKELKCNNAEIKTKIRIGDIPDASLGDIEDSTLLLGNFSSDSIISITSPFGEGSYIGANVRNSSTISVIVGSTFITGDFDNCFLTSTGEADSITGDFSDTIINSNGSASSIQGLSINNSTITTDGENAFIKCNADKAKFTCAGQVDTFGIIFGQGIGNVNSDAILTATGVISTIFGYANNGGSIRNEGNCSIVLSEINSATDNEITLNTGKCSIVMGRHLTNERENCLLLGQYGVSNNDKNNGGDIVLGANSIQIVGGVDKDATTSNTVMIGTSALSNIGAVGGGIANFWNVSGADYAEYFEWEDSNNKNEDRSGYFVDIKNNDKISIAGSEEYDIIGITTSSINSTSGYVGDCAFAHWKDANDCDNLGRIKTKLSIGKNLRDVITSNHYEYDLELQSIIENEESYPNIKLDIISLIRDQFKLKKRLFDYELSVLLIDYDLKNTNKKIIDDKKDIDKRRNKMIQEYNKLIKDINICEPSRIILCNPKHDKDMKYIPRSQRQEWIPVGLLGKLHVFDNGLCQVGQRCKNYNGIAVPDDSKKGWRVLERVSKSTIRILFK